MYTPLPTRLKFTGRMAERSKELGSSRSIFGCVGSNFAPVSFLFCANYAHKLRNKFRLERK